MLYGQGHILFNFITPTSPRAMPVMHIAWKQKEGRRKWGFLIFSMWRVESPFREMKLTFLNTSHFECSWGSFFSFPPFFSHKHHHVHCMSGICCENYTTSKLRKDGNITAFGVMLLTCDILKCWSLTDYINSEDPFLLESKGVCELGESWVVTA